MDNPGLKHHNMPEPSSEPFIRVTHRRTAAPPPLATPHTNTIEGYQTGITDLYGTQHEDVETPPPSNSPFGTSEPVSSENGSYAPDPDAEMFHSAASLNHLAGSPETQVPGEVRQHFNPPAAESTPASSVPKESPAARQRRIDTQKQPGGGAKENPVFEEAQQDIYERLQQRNMRPVSALMPRHRSDQPEDMSFFYDTDYRPDEDLDINWADQPMVQVKNDYEHGFLPNTFQHSTSGCETCWMKDGRQVGPGEDHKPEDMDHPYKPHTRQPNERYSALIPSVNEDTGEPYEDDYAGWTFYHDSEFPGPSGSTNQPMFQIKGDDELWGTPSFTNDRHYPCETCYLTKDVVPPIGRPDVHDRFYDHPYKPLRMEPGQRYSSTASSSEPADPNEDQRRAEQEHMSRDPGGYLDGLINSIPEQDTRPFTIPTMAQHKALVDMGFRRFRDEYDLPYWLKQHEGNEYMIGPSREEPRGGFWETSIGPVGHTSQDADPNDYVEPMVHNSFENAFHRVTNPQDWSATFMGSDDISTTPTNPDAKRPGRMSPFKPSSRPDPRIQSWSSKLSSQHLTKLAEETDEEFWARMEREYPGQQPETPSHAWVSPDAHSQQFYDPNQDRPVSIDHRFSTDPEYDDELGETPDNMSLRDHSRLVRPGVFYWDGNLTNPSYTHQTHREIRDADGQQAYAKEGHVIEHNTNHRGAVSDPDAHPLQYQWMHTYYPAGVPDEQGLVKGYNTVDEALHAAGRLSIWGPRHAESSDLLQHYQYVGNDEPYDPMQTFPHEFERGGSRRQAAYDSERREFLYDIDSRPHYYLHDQPPSSSSNTSQPMAQYRLDEYEKREATPEEDAEGFLSSRPLWGGEMYNHPGYATCGTCVKNNGGFGEPPDSPVHDVHNPYGGHEYSPIEETAPGERL